MSPEKLVRMANQIALFMETKPHAEGIDGFAAHISDFWEPRMRKQFFDMIAAGEGGFRPLVLEAAPKVRRPVEMGEA